MSKGAYLNGRLMEGLFRKHFKQPIGFEDGTEFVDLSNPSMDSNRQDTNEIMISDFGYTHL
jgi:hypothetical protein